MKAASQQAPAGLSRQIVPAVEQLMAGQGIKGLSMALVLPGEEPLVRGLGFSDLDSFQPMQASTLFPVASLTKTLTNIALLQLLEQGKINLDDPVQEYLPEFSVLSRQDSFPPITLHHLQCHTSGLPRDLFKGLISDVVLPRPDLLEYLHGQYLSFAPGTKYSYSNLGYELLGRIIEEVTGMPYQQYVTQHVLIPLGMKNSYFLDPSLDPLKIARPYLMNDPQTRYEPPLRLTASGGLYSCAEDFSLLLEFLLKAHHEGPLPGDSLVARMLADQKGPDVLDVSLRWGMSWLLEDQPVPFEGDFAYQIGNTLYYNSLIALAPEYGVGLVLFSNTAGTIQPLLDLARQIISYTLEEITGQQPLAKTPVEPLPVIHPDPLQVNLIRGDYLSENLFFQIFALRDDVILKVGPDAFRLFGNEDGWFRVNPDLRIKVRQAGPRKVLMLENDGYVAPEAIEVDPSVPMPPDIESRLGTYYVENIDPTEEEVFYKKLQLSMDENGVVRVTFALEDFQKQLYGVESVTYNLMPAAEGNMVFAGFGMYRGETLFLDQDSDGFRILFAGLEFYKPFSHQQ